MKNIKTLETILCLDQDKSFFPNTLAFLKPSVYSCFSIILILISLTKSNLICISLFVFKRDNYKRKLFLLSGFFALSWNDFIWFIEKVFLDN